MTRLPCSACWKDLRQELAREKRRAVKRLEASFPFECPGCGTAFQVSIDAAGELGLEVTPGGGLSTGSLVDGLFEDPEIRKRLFEREG